MGRQLVWYGCALLVVLGSVATNANDTKGLIVEKSFLQSVQDCVEYLRIPRQRLLQYLAYEFPEDDDTKCLIYCVGTDLRWWNSTCGLQVPALVNFFQPVLGDRQYEKRTKECVDRNQRYGRPQNSCCQAYRTFQCYFQEFGNLVTCPQYVPATKLQATQAALDCLTMQLVSVDLLQCYSRGQLPDVPETRCLYHCIDLRTGLYASETGLQLSRFYVRDLAANDLRYLSKETKICRDRIRQRSCDACSEVYDTHQECLTGLGENGYTSGIITEAAKLALANLGVCCSPPPEPVVEVGYSYASYQRVPDLPCKVCASAPQPQLAKPDDPPPTQLTEYKRSFSPFARPMLPPPAPTPAPSPPAPPASPSPPRSQDTAEDKPKFAPQFVPQFAPHSAQYPSFTEQKPKPVPVSASPATPTRTQLVYYKPSEAAPSAPETGTPFKPTFSAFSVRSRGPKPAGATVPPPPVPGSYRSKP